MQRASEIATVLFIRGIRVATVISAIAHLACLSRFVEIGTYLNGKPGSVQTRMHLLLIGHWKRPGGQLPVQSRSSLPSGQLGTPLQIWPYPIHLGGVELVDDWLHWKRPAGQRRGGHSSSSEPSRQSRSPSHRYTAGMHFSSGAPHRKNQRGAQLAWQVRWLASSRTNPSGQAHVYLVYGWLFVVF